MKITTKISINQLNSNWNASVVRSSLFSSDLFNLTILIFFFLFLQSALARQSLYVKFDPLVKAATPRSPGKLKEHTACNM